MSKAFLINQTSPCPLVCYLQNTYMSNLAFNEIAAMGLETGVNVSVKRDPAAAAFDLQKAADDLVLDKFAPAGVIINSNLEVINFRGRTGAYLEHFAGPPSLKYYKNGAY